MIQNDKVSAERVHIAFFGKRNAGKSSVVNAVTNQLLSVVSPVKGTTTDPVRKTMEILPLGPVVIIDTPGIDDEGELGLMRVQRAYATLDGADIAVLVVDVALGLASEDERLIKTFTERHIPYLIAFNKIDLLPRMPVLPEGGVAISAKTSYGIDELKNRLSSLVSTQENTKRILSDLVLPGEVVILVVPIDSSAPKGRLILPQQQVIRELLEIGAMALVVREKELAEALSTLKKPPRMVITDSQAFGVVSEIVPPAISLTSFSILFARYKGDLASEVAGVATLKALKGGERILISEGCTHHRQCQDIGSVKIPSWIRAYTGHEFEFCYSSGTGFPEDLSSYSLIVHCGACMLTEKEMKSRIEKAKMEGVPLTNYGILIAAIHGILPRALELFPSILALLK